MLLSLSLFPYDLHLFLQSSQVNLQMVHNIAYGVKQNILLKLYLFLYADDAVLLGICRNKHVQWNNTVTYES